MKRQANKYLSLSSIATDKMQTEADLSNRSRFGQSTRIETTSIESNQEDPNRKRLQNIDLLLEESIEDEQLSQLEMPISGSLKRDWGKLPFYDYPTN